MENRYNDKTFVEIGMEEIGVDTAVKAVSRPGTVLYERLKPLLLEVFGNNIIRPLMSPRRIHFN